jgi:excisionase family DNA binding protein
MSKLEPIGTEAKHIAAAITPATIALMYLRAGQVIQVLPISRRSLSNWQARRLIKFYKVGRTVLFKRTDIEAALEKFAVMPIGTPRPRKTVETGTITTGWPKRKRRMTRGASEAAA